MDNLSIIEFYRSSPDWVKAVWVLSLPAFTVAMTGLAVHYRIAMRRISAGSAAQPGDEQGGSA